MTTTERIKRLRSIGTEIYNLRTARAFSSEDEQTITALVKEALNKQYRQLGMETYTE